MANPNKRKGTNWETAVEGYLRGHGLDAERKVQRGISDVGDLHVWLMALQCKDVREHDLSGWIDAARRQAGHAGLPYSAVVVKRRRHGVAEGYVVMTLETLARLLALLKDR